MRYGMPLSVRVSPMASVLASRYLRQTRAQHAEIVRADRQHRHALGFSAAREVDAADTVGGRHGDVERPAAISVADRGQTGQVGVVVADAVVNANELLRFCVRK